MKHHINFQTIFKLAEEDPKSHIVLESLYEDYIKCTYCDRKFHPKRAEIHIEKCKNIINKPKGLPKLNSSICGGEDTTMTRNSPVNALNGSIIQDNS